MPVSEDALRDMQAYIHGLEDSLMLLHERGVAPLEMLPKTVQLKILIKKDRAAFSQGVEGFADGVHRFG